jgi:hypothetical protein
MFFVAALQVAEPVAVSILSLGAGTASAIAALPTVL